MNYRSFNVVNIVISDEEAKKRIALRRLSSDRLDDHFVPERLKEYEKYTKDAIEIFLCLTAQALSIHTFGLTAGATAWCMLTRQKQKSRLVGLFGWYALVFPCIPQL